MHLLWNQGQYWTEAERKTTGGAEAAWAGAGELAEQTERGTRPHRAAAPPEEFEFNEWDPSLSEAGNQSPAAELWTVKHPGAEPAAAQPQPPAPGAGGAQQGAAAGRAGWARPAAGPGASGQAEVSGPHQNQSSCPGSWSDHICKNTRS